MCFVVADGMGGHKGGATASKAIVKMVKREVNVSRTRRNGRGT